MEEPFDIFDFTLDEEEQPLCRLCSKREAAIGRTVCNTCRSRIWIDKNKVRYAWHMLKKSAKKRNLPFTVTYDFFALLCKNSGYIEKAGRLMDNYTIDRINGSMGYHNDNIMVLPKGSNSAKRHDSDLEHSDELVII